ncbi:MAG TPA: superoxide dismutase family protein, partial [Chloroflexota bacterium]|nr:superoxide dismutase family protein [Chloroflexota bacterium]
MQAGREAAQLAGDGHAVSGLGEGGRAGELRGLPPGLHGIHLHETGRCEAPFASAGAHFNP